MIVFQILPSLEKYGIHTMGCSIWGLTRFQSLWRSKLCELSCHDMSFHTVKFTEVIRSIKDTHFAVKYSQ